MSPQVKDRRATEPDQKNGNGSRAPDHELLVELFSKTARSYDVVVKLATLGMDQWWKHRLIEAVPADRKYQRILDLGCGTGIITMKLARRFPDAEIVGIDLADGYLEVARQKVREHGLTKVQLLQMNVEDMIELPGEFDLVVGSYIPKLVDLDRLNAGLNAKVMPGGVVVLHDFIVPNSAVLRCGYRAHWALVSAVMRMSRSWSQTSQHLRKLIWQSNWQEEIQRILTSNGFGDFYTEVQPFQVAKIVRAVRQG